jgi:C2H2-type zinc finger
LTDESSKVFYASDELASAHSRFCCGHRDRQSGVFACPDPGCARRFASGSALMQHFDSGSCPSRVNRHVVNRIVVRLDRNNIITNPAHLITAEGGYDAPHPSLTYATERSYNGSSYECFLCHREFHKLDSLNAHLQSPVHEDNIYRCPNHDGCKAKFSTMSALCQHAESDKCGVRRFRYVRNAMDSLLGVMHALGM